MTPQEGTYLQHATVPIYHVQVGCIHSQASINEGTCCCLVQTKGRKCTAGAGDAAWCTQPGEELQLKIARVVGAGDRHDGTPCIRQGNDVTGYCCGGVLDWGHPRGRMNGRVESIPMASRLHLISAYPASNTLADGFGGVAMALIVVRTARRFGARRLVRQVGTTIGNAIVVDAIVQVGV